MFQIQFWLFTFLFVILAPTFWFWRIYRKSGFSGLRERMRNWGLLLCLLLCGYLSLGYASILFGGSATTSDSVKLSTEDWYAIILPGLIIIGSAAVSWKWELIGATLLIAESSLWFISILIPDFGELYNPPLWISLFLSASLILLVPGILFLVSWWIERRQTRTPTE